uniref:protein FAM216A-like isoform X2 n=1 Tax=Solea senegalensis TaxID=28829 RepID=UPI001CD9087A|nr:protein FAM216A-like isoform X2 [Solea senegalensis]
MMRKRVTFVDHLKTESLSKNGSGHVLMRSAESNNRCTDGQQVRKIYREINRNALADSQHMTTVHIPKSVMSAPFLQHPALTTGQRRYLYSIANVYSTEHMRRQMKQHYLNVLHACLQTESQLQEEASVWRKWHRPKGHREGFRGKGKATRTEER